MDKMICVPGCTAPVHHTMSAYRQKCKSPRAREETRLYRKRRNEGRAEVRLVDSIGTGRRLQALCAIGYTCTDLAVRLGMPATHKSRVARLATAGHPHILPRTADAVAKLYNELWDKPGPSQINRVRAPRKGWVPPQAWDDETIDDPDATPQGVGAPKRRVVASVEECMAGLAPASSLSPKDRAVVIARLSKECTVPQIAQRIQLGYRTVQRYRAMIRQAA